MSFGEFEEIVKNIDDFVWGIPLIVIIISVGIYLTIRLKLLQIIHLPKALKYLCLWFVLCSLHLQLF